VHDTVDSAQQVIHISATSNG